MELDKLILEYENDFFKKNFCDNIQNLSNRIHEEFIEFGLKKIQIGNCSFIKELLWN